MSIESKNYFKAQDHYYSLAKDKIGRESFLAALRKTTFLDKKINAAAKAILNNLKSDSDWERFNTLDYLPIFSHIGKAYLETEQGFFADLEEDGDELLSPRVIHK